MKWKGGEKYTWAGWGNVGNSTVCRHQQCWSCCQRLGEKNALLGACYWSAVIFSSSRRQLCLVHLSASVVFILATWMLIGSYFVKIRRYILIVGCENEVCVFLSLLKILDFIFVSVLQSCVTWIYLLDSTPYWQKYLAIPDHHTSITWIELAPVFQPEDLLFFLKGFPFFMVFLFEFAPFYSVEHLWIQTGMLGKKVWLPVTVPVYTKGAQWYWD